MSATHAPSSHIEWAAIIGACFSLQDIPSNLIGSFLPAPSLPIHQFIKFKLHPLPPKKSTTTIELSNDFCDIDVAQLNDGLLRRINYPSYSVFRSFLNKSQLPPPLVNSIAMGPLRLPLGVLKIWSLWFSGLVIQEAWAATILWLDRLSPQDHSVLVASFNSSLDSIEWAMPLKGFNIPCRVGVLS
jgi:hypothetical protein